MRIRGKLFFATKIIVLGIGAATSNISRIFLYWVVFFCICFGLGFPVLNRFDPKTGSPDSISYYKLVTGRPSEAGDLLRYRVLVPWVAKPFFWAGDHHLGSWSPVAFGLLMWATGNDCKHRPGYIPEQTGGSQAMMECISLS